MKHIPNILTILRLLSCPLLIYLFLYGTYFNIIIVFIFACLTDFFDGYLARKESLKSNFGKVLDPIADKVLILVMCLMLIINEDISGMHKIAFYIIILREIIVSFFRYNLNNANENIDVSTLSKYKTFIQMIAILSVLLFHNFELFYFQLPIIIIIWIASLITVITGIQHFKTYKKIKK